MANYNDDNINNNEAGLDHVSHWKATRSISWNRLSRARSGRDESAMNPPSSKSIGSTGQLSTTRMISHHRHWQLNWWTRSYREMDQEKRNREWNYLNNSNNSNNRTTTIAIGISVVVGVSCGASKTTSYASRKISSTNNSILLFFFFFFFFFLFFVCFGFFFLWRLG